MWTTVFFFFFIFMLRPFRSHKGFYLAILYAFLCALCNIHISFVVVNYIKAESALHSGPTWKLYNEQFLLSGEVRCGWLSFWGLNLFFRAPDFVEKEELPVIQVKVTRLPQLLRHHNMYRVSNLLNARKHRRRMPKVHVSVQESPRKNERGKTQRRRELVS